MPVAVTVVLVVLRVAPGLSMVAVESAVMVARPVRVAVTAALVVRAGFRAQSRSGRRVAPVA
jgi:hypothetical protein